VEQEGTGRRAQTRPPSTRLGTKRECCGVLRPAGCARMEKDWGLKYFDSRGYSESRSNPNLRGSTTGNSKRSKMGRRYWGRAASLLTWMVSRGGIRQTNTAGAQNSSANSSGIETPARAFMVGYPLQCGAPSHSRCTGKKASKIAGYLAKCAQRRESAVVESKKALRMLRYLKQGGWRLGWWASNVAVRRAVAG